MPSCRAGGDLSAACVFVRGCETCVSHIGYTLIGPAASSKDPLSCNAIGIQNCTAYIANTFTVWSYMYRFRKYNNLNRVLRCFKRIKLGFRPCKRVEEAYQCTFEWVESKKQEMFMIYN